MSTPTRRFRITGFVLMYVFAVAARCLASCVPDKLATPAPRDPVALVLAAQQACPKNAIEFRRSLEKSGARLEPTMVNFEGFHNPGSGNFFIFEIVSGALTAPASKISIQRGDLLFGHFLTATDDGRLVPSQDDLLIELIAWDPDKQFYNFYELRGAGWVYRGDSKDILDDIRLLHRQRPASVPAFGERLRCSFCHVNGGLLQKELAQPHNDWFLQSRQLPMGGLKPDPAVKTILDAVVDADALTTLVAASPRRLADSAGYRKVLAARSMQEQLRPLFCPVEVNIESDPHPSDDRKSAPVRVPSGFFVDPRLATVDVSVSSASYDAAVQKLRSSLPRTAGRADADHPWLTPVKAHSDIVAVDALIERRVIDKEFALDVLAVDFTNPVFSNTRCALLKLVPDDAGADLVERFVGALRGASMPGAVELLGNLTDPKRNAAFHESRAKAFAGDCRQRAGETSAVLEWFSLLAQRRVEVSTSEISSDRRRHILEDPGRIVFPATQPGATAGRLVLTPACQVQ
jgi:hypothetical protein